MKFQGALLKEQGILFAIIIVKPTVMNSPAEEAKIREMGTKVFGAIPIVLMAQDAMGNPTYSGRRDIVQFLIRIPLHKIPWRDFTVTVEHVKNI
ncbi:MAG: hypothetical protein IJ955_02630 [Oscillospiraceae bacterium]|nr:hypothetical protein [Oscillospiraceae bacterium]